MKEVLIYIVMTIGGTLGILAHTFVAANKINKRLGVRDLDHVFGELWEKDLKTIIRGFFFFIILLFIAADYIDFNNLNTVDYTLSIPERVYRFRIANFIRTSSVIAGYFAESIVYGIFGKAEQIIKQKIDSINKIIGDIPKDQKQ